MTLKTGKVQGIGRFIIIELCKNGSWYKVLSDGHTILETDDYQVAINYFYKIVSIHKGDCL
jgi:hypothetical protein